MARKGRLEEIFSRALHSDDDPELYAVSYRDFNNIIEVSLPEFVRISEDFAVIPANRIVLVKRGSDILYQRHGFTLQ